MITSTYSTFAPFIDSIIATLFLIVVSLAKTLSQHRSLRPIICEPEMVVECSLKFYKFVSYSLYVFFLRSTERVSISAYVYVLVIR